MTHISRTANLLGALTVALHDQLSAADSEDTRTLPPAAVVHVSHCDRPTIESLRQVLGLSHSATVRLVDRLVGHGLLRRVTDPHDRRAAVLSLTAAGRRFADDFLEQRARTLANILLTALSPSEQQTFAALASKLLMAATGDERDLYRICRLCDFDVCSKCPVSEALA